MLCQPPLGFLLAGLVQRLCQGLEKSLVFPQLNVIHYNMKESHKQNVVSEK